jgi:site-specific DNA-cytosine methylase
MVKRQNGRRFKEEGEPSFTLTKTDVHGVMINEKIRRLTPIECELLQSFPKNWTKYGVINGKIIKISDTQRYKLCGNALTTNIITEIGLKLL